MQTRSDMIAVYVARPCRAVPSHEFLQLRRRPDDYLGGTWSTIYGMMESGETAWQAALRELLEETGVAPAEFYRLPTVRSFYTPSNDTLWHVPAFATVIDADTPIVLNDEHTSFRWIRRDHAGRQFLWATDRAAIEEVVSEILSPAANARQFLRIEVNPPRGSTHGNES